METTFRSDERVDRAQRIADIVNGMRKIGLNFTPAVVKEKRPNCVWRYLQTELARETVKKEDCRGADGVCVICGEGSGGLEVIDFDFEHRSFDKWVGVLEQRGFGYLTTRVLIEKTQSGGLHVVYKTKGEVEENQKLCRELVDETTADYYADLKTDNEVDRENVKKGFKRGDKFILTTIETRGQGGLIICAPSPGYEIVNDVDWKNLPLLETFERNAMIEAAKSLSTYVVGGVRKEPVHKRPKPADDFNDENSVADYLRKYNVARDVLAAHGWKSCGERDGKEFLTRPGKRYGVSASYDLRTGMFYCWSSSVGEIESNETYTPLQLVAAYDFYGDISACAKFYFKDAVRERDVAEATNAQYTTFILKTQEEKEKEKDERRNGDSVVKFPDSLFHCGGFIERYVDFANKNAHRRQPELAFAGALALLSFLCGRKVTTFKGKTFPNIYVMGVAGASQGKELARHINRLCLSKIEQDQYIVEKFESVQGLQNTIVAFGKVFLQNDEFGQELRAINTMAGAFGGGNKYGIIAEMLKLFSSSNNPRYSPRVTAGDYKPGAFTGGHYVACPHLTTYCSTNFLDFRKSMTPDLLANGFVARMTFVTGREYSRATERTFDEFSQDTPAFDVPQDVEAFLRIWGEYREKRRVIDAPDFFDVPVDEDAYNLLNDYQFDEIEPKVEACVKEGNAGEQEFLGRVIEKCRKYALLFAASENQGTNEKTFRLTRSSAENAIAFSRYEVAQFLSLMRNEVVSTKEQEISNFVNQWIERSKCQCFTKSEFTVKFNQYDRRTREDALQTLIDRGDVVKTLIKEGKRRPQTVFFTKYHKEEEPEKETETNENGTETNGD